MTDPEVALPLVVTAAPSPVAAVADTAPQIACAEVVVTTTLFAPVGRVPE